METEPTRWPKVVVFVPVGAQEPMLIWRMLLVQLCNLNHRLTESTKRDGNEFRGERARGD